MGTVAQGESTPLVVQFYQWLGNGPPVDVSGLTLQIVRVSDGAIVLGPTSSGIVHVATGVYSYEWAVPLGFTTGDYIVIWSGTYNSAPVQASEEWDVTLVGDQVAPGYTPCTSWPYVNCDFSQFSDPSVSGTALAVATNLLDAMTGYQFGACPITIRPCGEDCNGNGGFWNPGYASSWWNWGTWPRPLFFEGIWYNITCGNCVGGCSCKYISEIKLPQPVSSVQQVKLDGEIMPVSGYALRDYRYLMRVDGGVWPRCNDLTLDDTHVGTWSVSLQVGQPVPSLGRLAMGELACNIAALLTGATCALPQPVQTLTRQGVTMNLVDPSQFPDQRIGLYFSDLFIGAFNPHHLSQRAVIYDVDHGSGGMGGYSIRTGF